MQESARSANIEATNVTMLSRARLVRPLYVAGPERYTRSINNREAEGQMKMSRQAEISSGTDSRAMAGTGLEFECSRDLAPTGVA